MGAPGYESGFKLTLHRNRLEQPAKRKKPTLYFVNSMSDLFHENVPSEFIDDVFDVIANTPQHTYQILTKRADIMRNYFSGKKAPENAWLGVSVEDKEYGKPRIDYLRDINAYVRFLSVEPLLEDLGRLDLSGIHWVIVGGESGAKARPMEADWALNVKDQCLAQDVDFFFKQWGSFGEDGQRRSKKQNGRKLAGRQWDMIPAINAY
jgi:protein gp37